MTTVPTARDALMGNPPSAGHEPRKSDLVAVLEQMQMLAAVEMLREFHAGADDLPAQGNATGDKRAVLATAAEGGGVYRWDGSAWHLVGALPLHLTESISAQQAAASALAAAASALSAQQDAASAASSANLAGVVMITKSRAEADAALAGLSEGNIVEVSVDETRGDKVARYRVTGGAFEFLVEFTRTPDTDDVLNVSAVPGTNLTQALDAAVDRANHTGLMPGYQVSLPGLAVLAKSTGGTGAGWGHTLGPGLEFGTGVIRARTASTAAWQAGTSELVHAVSPADMAAAIGAQATTRMLGVGQQWQNVSASRTGSTSYQNTTGRPIEIVIRAASTVSSTRRVEASANNSTWVQVGTLPGSGQTPVQPTSVVIPDGWYYRVNGTFDYPGSDSFWAELR